MTLKEILVLVLPALIISSIYRAIVGMRNYSIFFFPAIILFICGSNFLHVLGSLNIANNLIEVSTGFDDIQNTTPLKALWNLPVPKIITNEKALYVGFFLGFIGYKKKLCANRKVY